MRVNHVYQAERSRVSRWRNRSVVLFTLPLFLNFYL